MEQHKYYSFHTNQDGTEATVKLFDGIGDFDLDTFQRKNTAEQFDREFRNATKDAEVIHVRINSPGGYVYDGASIYNTIYGSEKKVITYNDGLAASMAAVILLAGDEIHAFPNSLLMVHNVSSLAIGNAKDLEEEVKFMKKMDKSLGKSIEERLDISAEEVAEKYLNYQDNWYDSDEALQLGFYDNIIQKKKANRPEGIKNLGVEQLMNRYAAFFNPKNTKKMNKELTAINNTLGIEGIETTEEKGAYLNKEQLKALNDALSEKVDASELAKVKNQLETKVQEVTDKQKEVDQAVEAKKTAEESTSALEGNLETVAKKLEVEYVKDDKGKTEENILTAIDELGNAQATGHTQTSTAQAGERHTTDYSDIIDFESSIYEEEKKIRK